MIKKPGPPKGTKHDKMPRSEFGKNLIAIRRKKGISQVELAKKLGLHQRMISHYEGNTEGPTFDMMKKIAEALNVNLAVLIGVSKNGKTETETLPSKAIQKRWPVIAKLPHKDQQNLVRMIDGLALQKKKKKPQ